MTNRNPLRNNPTVTIVTIINVFAAMINPVGRPSAWGSGNGLTVQQPMGQW
ncbi:MAG TPA: hypothetical protein VF893_06010 [Candidatus Bathyarchaeia archaeon]